MKIWMQKWNADADKRAITSATANNKIMKYFKCCLLLGGLMVTLLTSCYTKEQRMKKQRETWIRRTKEFREEDSLYKLEHGIMDTVRPWKRRP